MALPIGFQWSTDLNTYADSGTAWLYVGRVPYGRIRRDVGGGWLAAYDLHMGHGAARFERFESQREARQWLEAWAAEFQEEIGDQVRRTLAERRKRKAPG